MKVDPAITKRIHELGGSTPPNDESLQEFLVGTRFPHYLYNKYWDFYGVDEFLAENRMVFDKDVDAFLDLIERHYFVEHDFAYGQDFWQPQLFTPITPGTPDFQEWEPWFAKHADLSPVRSLCGDGPLEFVQIIYRNGYPDHYYVCLQDPAPENPTVFATDHEVFFQEVSARTPLLQFLHAYCTRADFRRIVRDYINGDE